MDVCFQNSDRTRPIWEELEVMMNSLGDTYWAGFFSLTQRCLRFFSDPWSFFLSDFMVFSQFLLECDILNDVPFTFELFAAMSDLNHFCFGSHFGITDLKCSLLQTFCRHQDSIS